MTLTTYEIKDRLLQVIKEDGTVSDLRATLEIITMLENTTVTKKELEDTRLGKYINLVRKAAKDEILQKRAKKLIKTWQQMIPVPLQSNIVPSGRRASPKPSTGALSQKGTVAAKPLLHKTIIAATVNGNLGSLRTSVKANRKYDSQKRSVAKIETDGSNVKLRTDAKFAKTILKPNKNSTSLSRTSSPNPSGKPRQNVSSDNSFSCKTNGLKLKIKTMTPTSSWNDSDARHRRKRKHEDDSSPPDSLDSTRTSDEAASSTVSASLSPESPGLHEFLPTAVVERTASLSDSILKHSAPPDVAARAAKPPECPVATKNPNAGRLGVDGCLGGDGAWFSWSDSILVSRPDTLRTDNDPFDLLNILPYVELE